MSALLSGINRPESEMRSSDLKLPARAAPALHPGSLIDCIALSCGVSQLIRGLMCCMYVCRERQTAGGQGWSEQPLQDTSSVADDLGLPGGRDWLNTWSSSSGSLELLMEDLKAEVGEVSGMPKVFHTRSQSHLI
ncbi:Hypothetical predicted protein [Scomber scombrus]|uniref:Uncharacterized protein n=1 Tax=Scomber scombrus TaxID=13677 RepID=A0AAV1Q256_SCOSC